MSGEKDYPVQLRQSEYRRLMDSCRRADDVAAHVRSQLADLGREIRGDLQARLRAVDTRCVENHRRMEGLGDEIQRLERQTDSRLQEQSQRFRQRLEALDARLGERIDALGARVEERLSAQRSEYLTLIEEQSQALQRGLAEHRREFQRGIQAIHDDLARAAGDEHALAETWLENARGLLQLIRAQHRHEKFRPGAVESLTGQIALIEDNVRRGVFQSAIASAQQLYLRASELRAEIAQAEAEYDAYYAAARLSADEALAISDAQATCAFLLETGEGPREVAGRVDFWTSGDLGALRRDIEAERARLTEAGRPDASATVVDLRASVERSETCKQRCRALVERAQRAIVASQLRWQMGGTIAGALEAAGWELADEAWQGRDERGAFHVKLQNIQGDEIVTIFAPRDAPDGIHNDLHISFFDRATNDEQLRRARLDGITSLLRSEGMECGPPTCKPGTENSPASDEAKLDFDRVRAAPFAAARRPGEGA